MINFDEIANELRATERKIQDEINELYRKKSEICEKRFLAEKYSSTPIGNDERKILMDYERLGKVCNNFSKLNEYTDSVVRKYTDMKERKYNNLVNHLRHIIIFLQFRSSKNRAIYPTFQC